MAVYIKGMEMPTNADMAPTAVWVYPNGYAIVFNDNGRMQQYTQAVPVPPHGRLIDADALENRVVPASRFFEIPNANVVVLGVIEAAPTIIPAEEESNG